MKKIEHKIINGIEFKFCYKCKIWLELKFFCLCKSRSDGLNSGCKNCTKLYRDKNREKLIKYSRSYYQNNKVKSRNKRKEYYSKNKDKQLKQVKNNYFNNKEHYIDYQKEYRNFNKKIIMKKRKRYYLENSDIIKKRVKKYANENPGKVRNINSNYRAKKLNATPQWLTDEQKREIQNIYIKCSRISKETGIKHHVDHIVPLQGKTVRGLHVPWNLQIITATENIKKSNNI